MKAKKLFTFITNYGEILVDAFVNDEGELMQIDPATNFIVRIWHEFDELKGYWKDDNTFVEA